MNVEYNILNTMRIRFLVFVLLSIFSGRISFTQKSDNQLWNSAVLKLDINKKIRLDIEEQVRFNNNISHLNTTISEIGLRYELTKKIELKTGFRYTYDPESHNSLRFSGDISYTWSKKKFPVDVKYRLRYQNTIEEYTKKTSGYIRNRIKVQYNLSRLADPFVAFESYFRLNYLNRFTSNRYFLGAEWKPCKKLNLDTFFLIEDEFDEFNPKLNKIFGLELSYRFKL